MRERIRRLAIAPRIAIASITLAVLVAATFVALLLAINSLRDATKRESRAKDVTTASLQLENLLIEADTGVRGFLFTGNTRFLNVWTDAGRKIPAASARLRHAVVNDPGQTEREAELEGLVNSYLTDYAANLIEIARIDPATARAPLAQSEGRYRIATIRKQFEIFLGVESRRAAALAASARSRSSAAIGIGIAALAASAGLILLFGLYLARAVGGPVREVAVEASRVAAGDFDVRLREDGVGEIRGLTMAFNSMARSLEAGRQELTNQNALLQSSEAAKTELISIVSHELRTPLTSVLGFTRLLLQRDLTPADRRRYLEIVDTEARRLASLASDFLDVQLLEEGRIDLSTAVVDAVVLVEEQTSLFFGASGTHQLELEVPDGPLWVEADHDRLSQVIGNLLSNAIKYSPGAENVSVSASLVNGDVRIAVRDHGFGIAPDDRAQLFTKFFRGRAATSGIPGTGLGLAVSRRIVEAHGGQLAFKSKDGHGSTFWVDLPAWTGDPAA